MKKRWLVVVAFFLFFPNIVKADCTVEEKIALSKMVSNVKITPIFREETENFSIIISNITPSIYFKDMTSKMVYENTGKEVEIYNLNPNTSYRIKFLSAIKACHGEAITSTYVNLPGYNKYYKDPLCEGLEDYKICQKWVNYHYDRETFEKEVKKIEKKEEKQKQEIEEKSEVVKGMYDYLGELYERYYYIVLPIIIIACIITIVRLRKKEDLF